MYGTEPSGTGLTDSRTIFGKDSIVRVEHLTANECTLAVPRLAPQHKSLSQGAQAAAAVATNLVRVCALD